MISILIVEDHRTVAQMIGRFLEKYVDGAQTVIVGSAEAALERLAGAPGPNNAPDLAIVDVSLPQMSGIDLVAALKDAYPHLPCMMLSGHKEVAYARRSLEVGARGYVAKGNPSALVEGVRKVLDGEIYISEDLKLEMGRGVLDDD